MNIFNKKDKDYCIYQIKQDYNFNKKTEAWVEKGEPYCQLIAYGKSKKDIKDFVDIAWDLCNIFCWEEDSSSTKIYTEPITRDNIDYIYPVSVNFEGIVNSDIIICEKNNPKWFYAANLIGWKTFKTKELAEDYILNNNPILKKDRKI